MRHLSRTLPERLDVLRAAVELYMSRCFQAIEALHDVFVRPLTDEEKEAEKQWIDEHMGFVGEWRDGFVMYDRTIVVLFSRPGKDGDAYYTRKSNYGLNVQVRFLLFLCQHY